MTAPIVAPTAKQVLEELVISTQSLVSSGMQPPVARIGSANNIVRPRNTLYLYNIYCGLKLI